jgi:uncharacterized repeat protein (TIGR03803 family)
MVSSSMAVVALVIMAVAPPQLRAADLTTLVSFCAAGFPNCVDGDNPHGSLIADADGNLFGTTAFASNGFDSGGGTVFEVAKTPEGYASTPTTLVSFCSLLNCADGRQPYGGLIADASGNLFGTTADGGTGANGGTAFEIVKIAGGYASTPTTLVSFCALGGICADGASPAAGVIADADGNLFGTTFTGGANVGGGTVFEIVKTAGGYASTPTTLVSFCSLPNCADGAKPNGSLSADANGNLFGATLGGGTGNNGGTVFEIAKTAGGYASTPTTLVSFCALANCADGLFPNGGLIADANGNLFGTTSSGGANGNGTVFEIVKTAGGYASTPTTLVSFCALANCADGEGPQVGLIADANGNLFGTTLGGGANRRGTVFEIAKSASGYASTPTILVSFCSATPLSRDPGGPPVLDNCPDGSGPFAGLIADANGSLFGTTASGGVSRGGTVFEITDSGFVTPVAIPPSEVATTASGLAYSRGSGTFNGSVAITNITSNPISGPFSILFTSLAAGVTLANATGNFSGSPFLTVPCIANLTAGQSASVSVEFRNPSFGMINFTPVIYSGNL